MEVVLIAEDMGALLVYNLLQSQDVNIVIRAGLWLASLGLSLQPKRPRVLLFSMVPAGLEPLTGLLGLVGHLGVVSWSMG